MGVLPLDTPLSQHSVGSLNASASFFVPLEPRCVSSGALLKLRRVSLCWSANLVAGLSSSQAADKLTQVKQPSSHPVTHFNTAWEGFTHWRSDFRTSLHANSHCCVGGAQSASGCWGLAATMGDQPQDTEAGPGSGETDKAGTQREAAAIVSPPGSKTPPSMPVKRTIMYPDNLGNRQQTEEGSEPVDATALTKALKDYDEAGRRRERTPGTSPCRKRQRVYGDRYANLRANL